MSIVSTGGAAFVSERLQTKPQRLVLIRRSLHYRQMQFGLAITVLMIGVSLIGPTLAPYSPNAFVATPYSKPSTKAWLGTDYLGNDVLSRLLSGGRSVILLAFAATTLGVLLGLLIGFLASTARRLLDELLMGASDIIISIPQLVLALVLVSVLGPRLWLIVLVVGVSHAPRVARLVRSITMDLSKREFVESARLIGVGRSKIFVKEILPNLSTPLLVEYGLRLTWSIGIIAALSFLGFGIQPPHADWGRMINENRSGLSVSVWSVAAPVLCIFLFTLGTNLMSEGLSRAVAGVDRQSSGR